MYIPVTNDNKKKTKNMNHEKENVTSMKNVHISERNRELAPDNIEDLNEMESLDEEMSLIKKNRFLERRLDAEVQLNQVLWGRLMEKESEIISLKATLNMQ